MPHLPACVILASGQSRRFQRSGEPWHNKLLAPFRGRPLLEWTLDRTEELGLPMRTVVTRHPEVEALCRARGVDVVLHSLPHRNDTVRLGLQRATALSPGPLSGCMFCPADQPLLHLESLCSLLDAFLHAPDRICRLGWQEDGIWSPGSPVLFPADLFPALLDLPEDRGGSFVAERYPERVLPVSVTDPAELADVDTPADLRRLAALPP